MGSVLLRFEGTDGGIEDLVGCVVLGGNGGKLEVSNGGCVILGGNGGMQVSTTIAWVLGCLGDVGGVWSGMMS